MSIITLMIVMALIGFCLWLIITYIPMPEPVKKAIVVIVVVLVILWIVQLLLGGGPSLRLVG